MDFNCGEITDKMTNCCDEISDPTPILVASRIAQDHDPIKAGSFMESDRIEKSWADEKLVIRSLFHSDRIFSGIGPRISLLGPGSLWKLKTKSCHNAKFVIIDDTGSCYDKCWSHQWWESRLHGNSWFSPSWFLLLLKWEALFWLYVL